MKNILIIVYVLIACSIQLQSKTELPLSIYDLEGTCPEKQLLFIDNNDDNNFDILFYKGCSNPVAYTLVNKSINAISKFEIAYLIDGLIESKYFIILIYNPHSFRYTHKLYFDSQISRAIIEDYYGQERDYQTYEEADYYFYTKQTGNTLLVTKKGDIDVKSVMLCSLEGKIISNLQNVEGWSQFSFDMSTEPSGMYLLSFVAKNKSLSKRVIYVR